MPCVVCGRLPSDPDHIKQRGSGGSDDTDNCWPVCRAHHTERHKIGLNSFVKRYPHVIKILLSKGWRYEDSIGKWIRDLDVS